MGGVGGGLELCSGRKFLCFAKELLTPKSLQERDRDCNIIAAGYLLSLQRVTIAEGID